MFIPTASIAARTLMRATAALLSILLSAAAVAAQTASGDSNEVVLYAAAATRFGTQWSVVADASAARPSPSPRR